jgi:hypothetical protein
LRTMPVINQNHLFGFCENHGHTYFRSAVRTSGYNCLPFPMSAQNWVPLHWPCSPTPIFRSFPFVCFLSSFLPSLISAQNRVSLYRIFSFCLLPPQPKLVKGSSSGSAEGCQAWGKKRAAQLVTRAVILWAADHACLLQMDRCSTEILKSAAAITCICRRCAAAEGGRME